MGQGSLDTSVCTGQSGWGGQDMNSGDYGKPGTRVLDHDSWDGTAGTGQPGQDIVRRQWGWYEVCTESNVQGSGGLVFAADLVIPSKFITRPTWASVKSAGFDFTSLKQKKCRCSCMQRIGRLADCLDAFTRNEAPAESGSSFFRKIWPWDDEDMGLVGLKNRLGHSQRLLNGSCVNGFAAGLRIQ